MKGQPSAFEATRKSMNVLTARGITGTNVLTQLNRGAVPDDLLPHIRLVHGKNASIRKALARKNRDS